MKTISRAFLFAGLTVITVGSMLATLQIAHKSGFTEGYNRALFHADQCTRILVPMQADLGQGPTPVLVERRVCSTEV